jgi:ABC-type lipoprotein release transport system permease subunit
MCSGVLNAPVEGRIEILRRQLSKFLPEAKVIELKQVATARQKQRKMAKEYFALIVPFVVVVCGAWIGVLAMMNVRERRNEIGVFRALGFESGKIATLFLGKAAIIGILGALAGFIIGTGLSIEFGTKIFVFTAHMIKPIYQLLWRSLVGAPVFAALSSLIPAMLAVAQDPASVMSEE